MYIALPQVRALLHSKAGASESIPRRSIREHSEAPPLASAEQKCHDSA
jgi:hypothetical protein